MILKNQSFNEKNFDSTSFVTVTQLLNVLDNYPEFQQQLKNVYNIDPNIIKVLKIGNAKQLITSLNILDSQCEKIDIVSLVKDINLKTLMESEKALFEIFNVTDNFILKQNNSDLLVAETSYSAKSDLLDYYNFNKFANYCRDHKFNDLVEDIKNYLKKKNASNNDAQKIRLVYKKEDKKFYIRAVTSIDDYKDFGINFSVFVALMALNDYVEKTKNEIYVKNYVVNDSNLYVSFALKNTFKINSKLSLSFNLLLENDEVKRKSVSFNGLFELKFEENNKSSRIYLKPKGFRSEDANYPTDLLTYPHRGSVKGVFGKIQELPALIDHFVNQVKEDAGRISKIGNPDDIRKFISDKIKFSKKPEFNTYKNDVLKKLMSITVDSTFKLFELLREVEDLFQHDDVISKDFWRTKLYESLIERQ